MVIKPVAEWKNPFFRIIGYIFLFPLSVFYGLLAQCRDILYDLGFFKVVAFDSFVIGIGSLSVGGSGKTPLAEFLAVSLAKKGARVGVISNGFRKTSKGTIIVSDGEAILESVYRSGDEAYMMALNFLEAGLDIPVISASDRIEATVLCVQKFKCDVIILDDAFQYRKITKSVEFVVQDHFESRYPLITLPAGRLREFKNNLKRADAVIISKAPEVDNAKTEALHWGKDVIISRYRPDYLQPLFKPDRMPLTILANKKIVLFSALGYNGSFVNSVSILCTKQNAQIVRILEFQDHYWYDQYSLRRIFQWMADRSPSEFLVLTTQKDAVKIKPEWVPKEWKAHIFFLKSEFIIESQIQFENLIKIPQITHNQTTDLTP